MTRVLRNTWSYGILIMLVTAGVLFGAPVEEKGSLPPGAVEAADWPQWRGPNRDGRVAGPAWPEQLKTNSLERLWRVPLGPSYSGPIVSSNCVFTTETHAKREEAVHALDRKTGKELWQTEWKGAMKVPFFAKDNGSWIRATPAYDGTSLYVGGMRDMLVCLDATTGKETWRVDFVKQLKTPLPSFGFVSSPLIDRNDLYVQAGASVVKMDKTSGAITWRALRDRGGMYGGAFSSPMLATLAGKRQLLAQSRQKLAGIDLDTGKVLWSQDVPAFRGMNILTPVVAGDSLFTSSYSRKSWLYSVSRQDDAFQIRTVWTNSVKGYMSTPVVIDDHVYMHLQNERFACLSLKTGKRTWQSTRRFHKYASLVAQDHRILALTSDGRLLLIQADPTRFILLGDIRISKAETWAHLAVSGNELFIRELGALAAYRWRKLKE